MRKLAVFFGTLTCAWLHAAPAGPFLENDIASIRSIVEAIYRMDYGRSRSLCGDLMEQHPDDPLGYVFLARTIWQEEINRRQALSLNRFAAPDFFAKEQTKKYKLEPNPEVEAEFKRVSDEAIRKAKALIEANDRDFRAHFLLGLAYQNLVTFNASLRGTWRQAFIAGHNTKKAHELVHAHYPEFADALVSVGGYNYVAGSVNFLYKILGAMMGIHGDRNKGIEYLETAARESVFLGPDAKTLLVLLFTRDKQYEKAFGLLAELHGQFPENHLVQLNQGSLALLMNRPAEAVSIYEKLLAVWNKNAGPNGLDLHTVRIQLAIARRHDSDLEGAARVLAEVLDSPEAVAGARAVAHLEMGKTLEAQGRPEDAMRHYQDALDEPDIAGSHEEADRLIRAFARSRPRPSGP